MNILAGVCMDSLRNEFPQLIAEGFSPKKSHFNRLQRVESDKKIDPQLYVKCFICDNTKDTVDVKPLRSDRIHTFPSGFVLLQHGGCNVGDEVLIRCEIFHNEYYIGTLLEFDETSRSWYIYSLGLGGNFWINAKYVIHFHKFLSFKKMSLEYILN